MVPQHGASRIEATVETSLGGKYPSRIGMRLRRIPAIFTGQGAAPVTMPWTRYLGASLHLLKMGLSVFFESDGGK